MPDDFDNVEAELEQLRADNARLRTELSRFQVGPQNNEQLAALKAELDALPPKAAVEEMRKRGLLRESL
jgi:septal ring factor EnvC (AmiA/AmiB activator)